MQKKDFFILGSIIGILVFLWVWKYIQTKKLKKQLSKSRKAEDRAAKLLISDGFKIIEAQKRRQIITCLDGREYLNWVQADYVVEKKGKQYVVEVKTGEKATQITNSATRRQLLEYYYIYQPEGILLLDMECGKIQEVQFQTTESINQKINWYYIAGAFLLGVIFTLALLIGRNF